MKNKLFTLLFLMIIAIGNVQAYNLMGISPSNHVLYFNILDSENHTLSVTFPCNGGNDNYYYNYTKPEGDLIIPATITIGQNTWTIIEITDHAFYECNITSVEIPNTVKYIGSWAFYHTHIKHLTLPESVDAIGERVFVGSWLITLTLPEKDIQYGNGCFAATELTDVVIPDGVTVIPTDMFVNCGFLKHVSFPSTLTNIEHDAFAYCTALQEINIPSSVISIGVWAIGVYNPFRGTSRVSSISVDDGNPVYYSEGNCIIRRDTKTIISGCKNSVIPNDVVEIGIFAFESGVSGALHLPASVTNIQEAAFWNCSGITKIYSFNPYPPSMYVENDIHHSFAHVSRTIPVYVPAGCVEAYRNAQGWNEFENIVENNYCWDGTVADSYDGGNGTPENPYQIATAEQLALLAYQTNNDIGGDAYYVLTEDISLASCTGENIPWISIGIHEYENNNYALHCFTGHFDGGGHTIYGLYQNIENGLDYFGGLFGYTDGAEIKNINMTNCSISGIGGNVGSVVGFASRTDVLNCTAYDSYIRTTGSYTYAGGIVGYAGTPIGVSQINEPAFRISNCRVESVIVESSLYAGGIVGCVNDESDNAQYHISNCSTDNTQYFHVKGMRVGGIVGGMNYCTVEGCVNNSIVYGTGTGYGGSLCVGGIVGSNLSGGVISNSYNRGSVVTDYCYAGGIVGFSMGDVHNVYNTGEISAQETGYLGNIVGFIQSGQPYNCYWLENGLPGEGYPGVPYTIMTVATSFHQGATPTSWILDEPMFGTNDLLEALNHSAYENYTWFEDVDLSNDGFPVFVYNEPNYPLLGSEWYYEITNDDGSVTYQYLEMAADTTINDHPIHILVRINTLYDKDKTDIITHEYIYERNDKVYWWNKTLNEFTILYDFGAEEGDEWEIKVGNESITVHVDAVEQYIYESRQLKMLRVRDDADIFSGEIVCGIGHLTSFFPEKLMAKGCRVEGIRCFWQNGELVFHYGEQDCDEIYEEHHFGVEEIENENEFVIYPNPSHDVLFVKTCQGASLQSEYRITNIMGQTLMTGEITSENKQIDVSSLTNGIYFITFAGETQKFVVK
jgi:hypothetical protein